ncbi:MAG TPA: nuclear transport factor 2 family protein [Geothrix sp.]|nr:nuclear transport factor 2 family protein [Geothrix sp.]
MSARLATTLLACLLTFTAGAQEDPAHAQLRALKDGVVASMNQGDIEGQLAYLHPNVVVTWHNAEVSRGRAGVRNYLQKMLQGPNQVVEKFGVEVKVDELSILYGGDTAIAFGSAQEHFTMAGHKHFDLTGRWTATMVKEDGKWLVASLHASDNIFDNPLLNLAKKAWWWAAGGGLLLGGLAGWLIGRRR